MIQYSIRQDIGQRKTAFVAMVLLVLLGIGLGNWQLHRAEYKENLASNIAKKEKQNPLSASDKKWELTDAIYHQIIIDGYWLSAEGVWLDNRPHPQGRDPITGITTGFNLLMPMKIKVKEQDFIIWVNRGWAPRNFSQRDVVPTVNDINTKVQIQGVAFADAGKTYNFGQEVDAKASDGRRLLQNFSIANFSQKINLPYQPFIVRQDSEGNDGLDRNWSKMDSGASKHTAYAIQWFALSIMTFFFWLITGLRKQSKRLG
ncbi:SURF1 family protein [Polynucleobacter kasalickyi]|uniref:SURF1-like protein n=1 Tax=Polynucleobacter kasalickyi TaxID=1938817 RepID=A0A1W2AR44_9BURK|nr:SURF1 family protein [Polynucleobacter kasalickyi]SMC63187.1 Cytochrome oxidase assembly protein ShyY1 [Polynucleobacter kasalickyi]